jgi:ABC-type multidrug transport system fused ATPase/permease subunit
VTSGILSKVVSLLAREERWKIAVLLAAMLATSVLQVVSIASVMPFVGLVANPDFIQQNRWMHRVYDALQFHSSQSFLLATGVVVVSLFALGNALTALTAWFSYRFVWFNHQKIAERLLEEYLRKPYSFFLGRHGARLSKTLLSEVRTVVTGVMIPCLDVAAKGVSTILVVGLLVIADPKIALLVSVGMGAAYGVIFATLRRRQTRLGERHVAASTLSYRIATETLGAIKEVKVLGREAAFVARFRTASIELAAVNASSAIAGQLPSYALETLAVGGMLTLLLYLVHARQSLDQVLPIAAVYAVAGNRLMPAFQQIFAAMTMIRFNAAALDELHADMPSRPDEPVRPFASMLVTPSRGTGSEIRFRNVSFAYGTNRRPALKHIDLVIPRNATVGLVGATGSGKTTLVDLVLGLFSPIEGEILIDGRRLDETSIAEWRSRIGYVPQSIFLSDDSIAKNIAFGFADRDIDRAAVERAARAAHLHPFVAQLSEGYDTMVGERGVRLSGGERQRIGIARALYHNPDVLVMDEATSALDTVTEDAVMGATKDLAPNRTIILIAHRLSTVKQCDVLFLLEAGQLAARGTYDELCATSASFRAMAGLA